MTHATESLRAMMSRDAFLRVLYHFGFGYWTVDPDRFAVFIIDVDNVDKMNSVLGDGTGDQFLDVVAGRIRAILPGESLVSRTRPTALSVVAFNESSESSAEELCTRLHEAIRGPMTLRGSEVHLSASIGVAFADREARPLVAMQCAERAVERVKANGGDATFFHRNDQLQNMEIAA